LSDPVDRGKLIYEKAGCIACHGADGKGGFPNNNVHGGKIPPLAFAAEGYTKEELAQLIKNVLFHFGEIPLLCWECIHIMAIMR
jgi:cytochrome c